MKRILSTAGILLMLLFLLKYPQEALAASREGMGLWLNTLIPTLLPFLILTGFLIKTGAAEKLTAPARSFWNTFIGISPSGAYALILGLLCGYPMGAKITSDMYMHGKIGRREAEYLLTFTNHASPVFINTYMLHICLKDQADAGKVYLLLLLSAALTMVFFRFIVFRNQTITQENISTSKMEPSEPGSLGTLLDTSIMNGFETIARLGGYILLFSILSAWVRHYWKAGTFALCLLLGSLELTTGLHFLAQSAMPFGITYFCAMTMVSFGGLCILAQTKSVLHKELSVMPYICAKCVNAAIAAALTLVFLKVV
ncbi:MAG TPA: hypothetical protein IAA26_08150 [Candidatus Blautia faecipullorum]|nr:hypothetical protein [Candidatus Blautia faecipullorum]